MLLSEGYIFVDSKLADMILHRIHRVDVSACPGKLPGQIDGNRESTIAEEDFERLGKRFAPFVSFDAHGIPDRRRIVAMQRHWVTR
jgi:hypothetical protein